MPTIHDVFFKFLKIFFFLGERVTMLFELLEKSIDTIFQLNRRKLVENLVIWKSFLENRQFFYYLGVHRNEPML